MPKAVVHEVKTISSHKSYHGWPTVARLQNGELWVVVSAGRERHVCPFGQVHLICSRDNGKTWTPRQILANGPLDDRDAGIWQTTKGTILVNWFTSVCWLRHLEDLEAVGPAEVTKNLGDAYAARCEKMRGLISKEIIGRELGTWMLRSTDNGKSWSPKYDCGVGSPHGPTELADGRLLFVGNRKDDPNKPRAENAYAPILGASESRDDGLTWRRLGDIPVRPGDPVGTYHETHAVQAPDGRIVVHIRNHSPQDTGYVLQTESTDGGRTFSVPRNTGLLGLPNHLLKLRDGRLLTTYGYRHVPYGNRASVSEDGGRTWSAPMILDEKPEPRDLGYPSTVELEDGSLLSVWYEHLPADTMASVQACRWRLE